MSILYNSFECMRQFRKMDGYIQQGFIIPNIKHLSTSIQSQAYDFTRCTFPCILLSAIHTDTQKDIVEKDVCSICLELPTLLSECKHSICHICLYRLRMQTEQCPVCRKKNHKFTAIIN